MDVPANPGRESVRLILVLLLLGLALAGCASHKSTSSGGGAPQGTTISTFSAYSADGSLAVTVADVAAGSCFTGSAAAPAPGAYRCFAGNNILDPCFAPPVTRKPLQIACVAAPWSRAVVLTVSGRLPAADTTTGVVRPWAFQLATGVRCVASTGTVPAVHGVNLGYHCTDGGDAALRTSAPSAAKSAATTVTADYGNVKTQTLRPVTVTTIWRA
jgi:hypothetical protein